MAGSIKWFQYTTNSGAQFGYLQDESNSEIFGTGHDVNLGLIPWAIPQNLEMRRANYNCTTSVQKRSIVVPTQALYDDLALGGVADGSQFTDPTTNLVFKLSGLSPERIKPVIIDNDTGLNDGDAT